MEEIGFSIIGKAYKQLESLLHFFKIISSYKVILILTISAI